MDRGVRTDVPVEFLLMLTINQAVLDQSDVDTLIHELKPAGIGLKRSLSTINHCHGFTSERGLLEFLDFS